jgi:hypothetical protein
MRWAIGLENKKNVPRKMCWKTIKKCAIGKLTIVQRIVLLKPKDFQYTKHGWGVQHREKLELGLRSLVGKSEQLRVITEDYILW